MLNYIVIPLSCVPLSAYCEMTKETTSAIDNRVDRGIWQLGVHILKVPHVRERWVDLDQVAKWARQNSAPLAG